MKTRDIRRIHLLDNDCTQECELKAVTLINLKRKINKVELTSALLAVNSETDRVRHEMEGFDDAVKKLEHVHFSTTLKLNVGGHIFSTSLETLIKDPGINIVFKSV